MPCHDIERRVIHFRRPQAAEKFADQLAGLFDILVVRPRREEIAWIGKAIGTDWPEVGQLERRAEILANVATAARRALRKVDAKAQAAWYDGNLQRLKVYAPQFGVQDERALLRYDEQFAIGIIEVSPLHGSVDGKQINSAAHLSVRRTVAGDRHQTIDEI